MFGNFKKKRVPHIKINVEIEHYDRRGMKELLPKIAYGGIIAWEGVINEKHINKLMCTIVSIFVFVYGKFPKNNQFEYIAKKMKFKKIKYKMGGEQMKLELEMGDLDLDMILEMLLKNAKAAKLEKQKSKNEDSLKESDEMIFGILETINKDLAQDKKYELINMLLMWLSENGVINSALNSMAQGESTIGDKLKKLDLSVNKISLTQCIEKV